MIIVLLAVLVAEIATAWLVVSKIYHMANDPDEANRDFFSVCPPNKIIITMFGANPRKYISNCRGIDFDPVTGILYFIPKTKGGVRGDLVLDTNGKVESPERFQNLTGQRFEGKLDTLWGIHWLGLPPMGRLYSFKSEWNDVTKRRNGTSTSPDPGSVSEIDFGFRSREKLIASFSIMRNYGWIATGLETGKGTLVTTTVPTATAARPDMVQIDIYIFTTIIIYSAYQALIMTNWTEGVDAVIRRVCTAYTGNCNTDNLGSDGGQALLAMLWAENKVLKEKYGVIFYNIEYNGWDYSGTPEEKRAIKEASRKVWLAKQTADAYRLETDSLVDRTTKQAVAEAGAINVKGAAANEIREGQFETYRKSGDRDAQMATADAISVSKPNVLSLNGAPIGVLAQPGKAEEK